MGFTTPSLKGRALRLLGQREHSRLELQRKLAPHVQEGEDLVAVLDELEAKGFISEQRVVDSVLHQRARRLGSARIRQELQAKGIAPEAMAQALDGLATRSWPAPPKCGASALAAATRQPIRASMRGRCGF